MFPCQKKPPDARCSVLFKLVSAQQTKEAVQGRIIDTLGDVQAAVTVSASHVGSDARKRGAALRERAACVLEIERTLEGHLSFPVTGCEGERRGA